MASDVAALPRENAVAQLEEKLQEWMYQQPEWLVIVGMERPQRRAAMRELANRLYTIPLNDTQARPTREQKRKVKKNLTALAREAATQQVKQAIAEQQEQLEQALAQAVLEEARASVALDGETQSVEEPPDPIEHLKADIEAGKQALIDAVTEGGEGDPKVAFIETDEVAELVEEEEG